MWVDDSGTIHTISVPDAGLVLGQDVMRFLGSLSRRQVRRLDRELERLRNEIFDLADGGGLSELGTPGAVPERPVLEEKPNDVDELEVMVGKVPIEWRLDAIEACQEVVDDRL
jgi:hypothetical protein